MSLPSTFLFVANKAHNGQFRKHSGLPYFCHCVDVLSLVSSWYIFDEVDRKAAVSHDVLEDCPHITEQELFEVIGSDSFSIVKELTFTYNPLLTAKESVQKQEYLQSFNNKTLEALVIKLADRICNVWDFCNSDFEYAKEYFANANVLFAIFNDRMRSLEDKYGKNSVAAMKATCDHLFNRMDQTVSASNVYSARNSLAAMEMKLGEWQSIESPFASGVVRGLDISSRIVKKEFNISGSH